MVVVEVMLQIHCAKSCYLGGLRVWSASVYEDPVSYLELVLVPNAHKLVSSSRFGEQGWYSLNHLLHHHRLARIPAGRRVITSTDLIDCARGPWIAQK